MSIAEELLNILCCPETRQDLKVMNDKQITTLNRWIRSADVHYRDGSGIDLPVTGALITEDGSRCYLIIDDIPVMLTDKIIDLDEGWQSM
ncbi:MAG TPA: Trm112 family protein [Caldithrix abyssi]|uniref:Trm112 family protein n=1 Tax=Caldithrix abyssi TaxID=187145 RepID=A0A7V5RQ16_CALAY|nr:Trm112 family protein [Caldithrix abyssi]